jgi:hypothetical protein
MTSQSHSHLRSHSLPHQPQQSHQSCKPHHPMHHRTTPHHTTPHHTTPHHTTPHHAEHFIRRSPYCVSPEPLPHTRPPSLSPPSAPSSTRLCCTCSSARGYSLRHTQTDPPCFRARKSAVHAIGTSKLALQRTTAFGAPRLRFVKSVDSGCRWLTGFSMPLRSHTRSLR